MTLIFVISNILFWRKSCFFETLIYISAKVDLNNNFDLLLESHHSNSDKLSKLYQKEEKTLLEMEKDDFRTLSMYQVFKKKETCQSSNSVPKVSFILYNVRIRI
jgi:ABC-type enterochelin transport system substrate-binding protein